VVALHVTQDAAECSSPAEGDVISSQLHDLLSSLGWSCHHATEQGHLARLSPSSISSSLSQHSASGKPDDLNALSETGRHSRPWFNERGDALCDDVPLTRPHLTKACAHVSQQAHRLPGAGPIGHRSGGLTMDTRSQRGAPWAARRFLRGDGRHGEDAGNHLDACHLSSLWQRTDPLHFHGFRSSFPKKPFLSAERSVTPTRALTRPSPRVCKNRYIRQSTGVIVLIESSLAKWRFFRIPEFLGGALILAALAIVAFYLTHASA